MVIVNMKVVHRADFVAEVHQVDFVVAVLRVVEGVVVDLAVLVDFVVLVAAGLLAVVVVAGVAVLISVVAVVFFSYRLFPGFANLSVLPVLQTGFRFLLAWMRLDLLLPVRPELHPGGLKFLFFLLFRL